MNLIDELAKFDRERIPERVVHAKGGGAFGYFEVTRDITKYCSAKIFDEIGKRTRVAVRFSVVGGESGSADTVRDPRGFAIKFYTEDGIWDLVGNNTPIFFIRDPILFPSFIHTQKRNPVTNLKDPDMFWDFISLRPETTHQVMILFSDRGIPDGFRRMHGYGSHTFKTINVKGDIFYVKFHLRTDQGIRNLNVETAQQLTATDPDYSVRDLYNAIAKGQYPSWTMYIQVLRFEQAESFEFNPFDVTKVWPQAKYPLIRVGKLVLNQNPKNYFAEIEQLAFNPGNLPPGIEPSPDKMLQGRLFSYAGTHRHRLGTNFLQLPVNDPNPVKITNYQRDGPMTLTDNQNGMPNYFPNSFSGPVESIRVIGLEQQLRESITGDIFRFESGNEDNYSQATIFWNKVLDAGAKERLVDNISSRLVLTSEFIQERVINNFYQVSAELGGLLSARVSAEKYDQRGKTDNMKFSTKL